MPNTRASKTEIQPTGLLSRSIHFFYLDSIIGVGPVCEGLRAIGIIGGESGVGEEQGADGEVAEINGDGSGTVDADDEQPVEEPEAPRNHDIIA